MADKPWEPSRRERRVLLALTSGASNLYGNTVIRASQVGSGTVGKVLARLEANGWVTGEFHTQVDGTSRRCYALTPEGRKAALGFLRLED
jgi:DNA-binding PadR family transcriptional regulator